MRPLKPSIEAAARACLEQARAHHHRRLIALTGPRPWGVAVAAALAESLALPEALWILSPDVEGAPEGAVPPARARSLLGQEGALVVVDLHDEPDPDVLGVSLGLPRGGGLLVWLTPPLEAWASTPDRQRDRLSVTGCPPEAVGRRFVGRLARLLFEAPEVTLIHPEGVQRVEVGGAPVTAPSASAPAGADLCLTEDQREAVAAVRRVVTGRAGRPVVLTADRGRGKSAALGIAAGGLLAERPLRVCVTAPARQAAGAAMAHARRALGVPEGQQDLKTPDGGRLWFMSPGDLLDLAPEVDLLLVDEAATLPLPALATLLRRYPRVAFATTVHGYEGTGRGFTLKFPSLLSRKGRGWRAVRLRAPIRWAPDDPVEAFGFRALLMDAEPPEVSALPEGPLGERATFEAVDRDRLVSDEAELADLFGLLITAHYRTGPADLVRLLDSPNVAIYGLRVQARWVSAALVSMEGGLSPELCAETLAGRRRPAGHMLPETLIYHSGLSEAAPLRFARVVRIATHPELQGRGLGRRLLRELDAVSAAEGLDALGSVFGATPELLSFWRGAGFEPVRLGVRRGKSSGAYSAVVVKPLTEAAQRVLGDEPAEFRRRLPHQLADPLRDLDSTLALALLRGGEIEPPPPPRDAAELRRCAEGTQDPDLYSHALWQSVTWALRQPEVDAHLSTLDKQLLLMRFVQRRPYASLGEMYGASGRAKLIKELRQVLGRLASMIARAPAGPAG